MQLLYFALAQITLTCNSPYFAIPYVSITTTSCDLTAPYLAQLTKPYHDLLNEEDDKPRPPGDQ